MATKAIQTPFNKRLLMRHSRLASCRLYWDACEHGKLSFIASLNHEYPMIGKND